MKTYLVQKKTQNSVFSSDNFFLLLCLAKTFIQSHIHWNLNVNAGTMGANNYWFERNLVGVVAVIVAVHHLLLCGDCLARLDRWLWEVDPDIARSLNLSPEAE